MAKVTKNSINASDVDFSATALDSKTATIKETDTIEFYYASGEVAVSVTVEKVLIWMEGNNIHVADDQEPYEVNPVEYLDQNFEEVTTLYFHNVYAINGEVRYAA
ncbi:hypothetical protein ACJVDH_00165 [Pedobacter sp. AW1-32]|uniref:hypothetical protein n=1 Tax=Pedobacter sp. AW1-32 TaxID=3383026 RepID=UPI003FF09505